ncbi:DUF1659 domain-containing protein [Cetobacterium sp.]|uniref:DUF1659 domain-containing protein n=1 Tax=Cetobacterium sp. TaxID=2071632 RepID=UPI003F2DAD25
MSVSEVKNPSSLKIKLDCGPGENGKTIVKSRTYSNLKAATSTQDTLDVARALISLQIHSELEINKQDNTILN